MATTTDQNSRWNNFDAKPLPLFRWLAVLSPLLALAFLLTACGSGATAVTGIPAAATPSTAPLAVTQPKVSKVVTDQGEQVEFNEAPPLNDGVPSFISFVTVG